MSRRAASLRVAVAAVVTAGSLAGAERGAGDTARPSPPDLSWHSVVLMFDDGWQSVFTEAYPLLKAHHATASLALISGALGGSRVRYAGEGGYLNRAEVQEMIDTLGIEIVSHSVTHPFLTRLTDDSVRFELAASRHSLSALFHRDVRFFVYPYGDQDSRIRGLVAEAGYTLGRGIRPGVLDFGRRPYNLPSTEVRKTTTLDHVKNEIIRRPELILFFHRILPSPNTYTEWSARQFSALLDWLDANQVQIVTLADLHDAYLGKTPVARIGSWTYRVEWDLLQEVNVDVTRAAERR